MERLFNEDCDPKQLSPLTLAFVGDAAFELFVRERLVCLANCPVKKLHQNAVAQVRCQAQGKVYGTTHANFNRRRNSGFKKRKKC